VHLDRGYDSKLTRERLEELGLRWEISGKGKPAPYWATIRWVVERTSAWHNAHKSFYEKAIPVKGRRGGSDRHPKSVTCAPLRVLLSALLWGQLPGDPVHDEVRPDSKALQSRVRSPSAKGPSSCSQSPKTGRFRALVIAPR
jgi:hypothetical protein